MAAQPEMSLFALCLAGPQRLQGYNFYVNSGQIALPVDLLRYVSYGAGAASRRRPCTPLGPAKSPLRGPFDLSLQAAGRAEAASLQNTASARIHAGCPGLPGTSQRC